jgi:hypothetical protein
VTRLTASRWLDRAGLFCLGVALFLYVSQDALRPSVRDPSTGGPNYGGAGTDVLIFYGQWGCAILGVLLFTPRALLRLRWWYSWIAFLIVGGGLLIAAFKAVEPGPSVEMHTLAPIAELAGLACIFMGFIYFVAQLLVRRAEANGKEHTSLANSSKTAD